MWVVPLRGQLSKFNILDPATRTLWAKFLGPHNVLIFDCLRPALDALGLSEDKDAGKFLEALDELTTEAGIEETLVVHHMGHSQERSRGDSRILDWPDAVWKLVREQDEDDEDDQATQRRYFTAYGRDVDQPEIRLAFDPATRHLTAAGGSRHDSRAERLMVAIQAFLEDNPDSSKQAIERGVEGRAVDIRKALARLVKAQIVLVEQDGRAHRHSLNKAGVVHSSDVVPDEWTSRSSELVHSSIDEGRGRHTPQDQPINELVPDEIEQVGR
ncbi:MAG: hypothetical protein QM747_18255 [Nocardioides sp.]